MADERQMEGTVRQEGRGAVQRKKRRIRRTAGAGRALPAHPVRRKT